MSSRTRMVAGRMCVIGVRVSIPFDRVYFPKRQPPPPARSDTRNLLWVGATGTLPGARCPRTRGHKLMRGYMHAHVSAQGGIPVVCRSRPLFACPM